MSTTRPFRLPQVSPPPLFAPCSRQLAVALHLSRTLPPEGIERGKERKKEKFRSRERGEKRMKTRGRLGDEAENQVGSFKRQRGIVEDA